MKRRHLLLFTGTTLLWAPLLLAQTPAPNPLRVGWLSPGRRAGQLALVEQLRKGFRDLGYVEGRNLVIEARFGEGDLQRLPALGRELAGLKLHAIVTAFS